MLHSAIVVWGALYKENTLLVKELATYHAGKGIPEPKAIRTVVEGKVSQQNVSRSGRSIGESVEQVYRTRFNRIQ